MKARPSKIAEDSLPKVKAIKAKSASNGEEDESESEEEEQEEDLEELNLSDDEENQVLKIMYRIKTLCALSNTNFLECLAT